MLDPKELDRAVDLQQRSYNLLKWVADAVTKGLIRFSKAHQFTTFPEASKAWILGHYLNIPADARPSRENLDAFCEFFKTYLENSFDLDEKPKQILYSPQAHCFCPHCSWMINAPHLKTKKLSGTDKHRAQTLKIDAIRRIAVEHQYDLSRDQCAHMIEDATVGTNAALVAYGHNLIERAKGVSTGPAVLALWRSFAWTNKGSPRPKFALTSKLILVAEKQLVLAVQKNAPENVP